MHCAMVHWSEQWIERRCIGTQAVHWDTVQWVKVEQAGGGQGKASASTKLDSASSSSSHIPL